MVYTAISRERDELTLRLHSIRLGLLILLSLGLGYIVQRDPSQHTLTLPEKGISVTLPDGLEGWVLAPGEGDVLVTGHTHLNLFSLEIAEVTATATEIDAYMEQRSAVVRIGKDSYKAWHIGTDSRFGRRVAPTYKATYQERLAHLPFRVEHWIYESYWPYRGHYVRISMRYPDFLTRYVEPDKYMLAAGLKLDK